MLLCRQKVNTGGFSLVEVIIVSALTVMVFGAMFASYQYSLRVLNHAQARLSAMSVAQDRMEYFRSLPYDEVGVVAGYPAGIIPQNGTTTMNGIEFVERVRVDYIDDPADGTAASDSNGIILDYKRVRLEYTWNIAGATSSIQFISNIVPRSVETTAGGGTARINVIDADAGLLPGASVRLYGSSSTFPYDVTQFTDASGAALFNVPADSGYQVEVTANLFGEQYSTDATYEATTSNPNPVVAPFTVLESDVSTLTFQIGELSDLTIKTYSDVTEGQFNETFDDLLAVASSSGVVGNGDLELFDTAGVYETSGYVFLGPITPVPVLEWQTLRVSADTPVNTSYKIQFFTGAGAGPYTLIPNADLPGNSTGFVGSITDISVLDVVTYPSVFVGIALSTANTTVTPEVEEVAVFYRQSETALANATANWHGLKVIGTDALLAPIYKLSTTTTTNGAGMRTVSDLEFDTYTFDFTGDGFDIASGCATHPFVHEAGVDGEVNFVLVGNAANTLRVHVVDSLDRSIPGASVQLIRTGYDVTQSTDSCGQTFFTGGVGAFADYKINVNAVGYITENVDPFEVAGDAVTKVILTE